MLRDTTDESFRVEAWHKALNIVSKLFLFFLTKLCLSGHNNDILHLHITRFLHSCMIHFVLLVLTKTAHCSLIFFRQTVLMHAEIIHTAVQDHEVAVVSIKNSSFALQDTSIVLCEHLITVN